MKTFLDFSRLFFEILVGTLFLIQKFIIRFGFKKTGKEILEEK